MALYYDVIHIFDTPANLVANLKNGMIGYDITNDRFAVKRLADGTIKYWENDVDKSFVETDGSTDITGDQVITGELGIQLYQQDAEPTLSADGMVAFWKDTNDLNKIYLIFRRGSGNHVKIQLT